MKLTYDAYKDMLMLLQEKEYSFCNYENHSKYSGKKCILRHDIDMSIEKALRLSEIENQVGVSSTWFVLVTSDFKYVSDSRMRWENPILDIISNEEYERLHILTHPIWYNQTEIDFAPTLNKYVDDETLNTKRWLHREISDLDGII